MRQSAWGWVRLERQRIFAREGTEGQVSRVFTNAAMGNLTGRIFVRKCWQEGEAGQSVVQCPAPDAVPLQGAGSLTS